MDSWLVGITEGAGCQYLFTYYTSTFEGLNLTQGMLNLHSGVRPGVRVFLFFSFLFPFFSFEWQEDLGRFGYRPDLHFKNSFFSFWLPAGTCCTNLDDFILFFKIQNLAN